MRGTFLSFNILRALLVPQGVLILIFSSAYTSFLSLCAKALSTVLFEIKISFSSERKHLVLKTYIPQIKRVLELFSPISARTSLTSERANLPPYELLSKDEKVFNTAFTLFLAEVFFISAMFIDMHSSPKYSDFCVAICFSSSNSSNSLLMFSAFVNEGKTFSMLLIKLMRIC